MRSDAGMNVAADELEALLAEGVEGALRREQSAYDAVAAPYAEMIVLFGAGGLGRRSLSGLRKHGIEPLAFADNNRSLWGGDVDGVPVLSPDEAARRYADRATFVITIWGDRKDWTDADRMRSKISQLRSLGCERVVSFGPLYWKFANGLLPYYGVDLPHKVHEQASAVREAFRLWSDDSSQREYLRQLRWRLFLDFDCLRDPVSHPLYFAKDLCTLTPSEVFVDCGAFDGDTVELFLHESGGKFRTIVALEPDPGNFARLEAALRRVVGPSGDATAYPFATGEREERLRLLADGSPASRVASSSSERVIEVDAVRLDDLLRDRAPTYVKMDIEGSELSTLAGASRVIREDAPVLTISAYHRQEDLWNIPRFIHSQNADYRFFLRPHKLEAWDLVCYAIPKQRCLAG